MRHKAMNINFGTFDDATNTEAKGELRTTDDVVVLFVNGKEIATGTIIDDEGRIEWNDAPDVIALDDAEDALRTTIGADEKGGPWTGKGWQGPILL